MDKTRRSVYKQTTDMEQRKVIKGNRWILLGKDPEKLDKKYKKRLDNILETNPWLLHITCMKTEGKYGCRKTRKRLSDN